MPPTTSSWSRNGDGAETGTQVVVGPPFYSAILAASRFPRDRSRAKECAYWGYSRFDDSPQSAACGAVYRLFPPISPQMAPNPVAAIARQPVTTLSTFGFVVSRNARAKEIVRHTTVNVAIVLKTFLKRGERSILASITPGSTVAGAFTGFFAGAFDRAGFFAIAGPFGLATWKPQGYCRSGADRSKCMTDRENGCASVSITIVQTRPRNDRGACTSRTRGTSVLTSGRTTAFTSAMGSVRPSKHDIIQSVDRSK